MNDTSADIEKKLNEMYAAKTPIERLNMMGQMFEAGRILARAGIENRLGKLSESRMRGELFKTFYGDCFSPEEIRVIASKIPNMSIEP